MTEKTPETPRWPENWEYWHKPSCPAWLSDTSFERGSCECGLTDKLVALADEYKAKVTHLEGALREAEEDRDSWKETAKHTVSASIAETIDDIMSDLQAKLREAERQRDEVLGDLTDVNRVQKGLDELGTFVTQLEIINEMSAKLREAEAKAALADKLVEHFDGDMHGDPCDAVIEFLDAMAPLQQPRAGEIR